MKLALHPQSLFSLSIVDRRFLPPAALFFSGEVSSFPVDPARAPASDRGLFRRPLESLIGIHSPGRVAPLCRIETLARRMGCESYLLGLVKVTGSRSQMAGSGSQLAESRSQVAGSRSQVAESRSQVAESRNQVTESRSQVTESRSQVAMSGSRLAESRKALAGMRRQLVSQRELLSVRKRQTVALVPVGILPDL